MMHLCYKTTSLQRDQSLNLPIVYSITHETPLVQDHLSTETSPSTASCYLPNANARPINHKLKSLCALPNERGIRFLHRIKKKSLYIGSYAQYPYV